MDRFVQVIKKKDFTLTLNGDYFKKEIQHNLDTEDICITVYGWDKQECFWYILNNYIVQIIDSNHICVKSFYNNKFKIVIFG